MRVAATAKTSSNVQRPLAEPDELRITAMRKVARTWCGGDLRRRGERRE
jgi:hypothetical protein